MAHYLIHAQKSAEKYGGSYLDYIKYHKWLDEPYYWVGDMMHRMFRHHSEGIAEGEQRFGQFITIGDNVRVYIKYILRDHILEDCDNYLPSAKEWLTHLRSGSPAIWMLKTQKVNKTGRITDELEEK